MTTTLAAVLLATLSAFKVPVEIKLAQAIHSTPAGAEPVIPVGTMVLYTLTAEDVPAGSLAVGQQRPAMVVAVISGEYGFHAGQTLNGNAFPVGPAYNVQVFLNGSEFDNYPTNGAAGATFGPATQPATQIWKRQLAIFSTPEAGELQLQSGN